MASPPKSHPEEPPTTENPNPPNFYPNCDVNVWLRSSDHEITKPMNGTITGTIPPWLEGSLLRNGPGSIKVGNDYFEHLFDSSALLHRFCIENGTVTYQCRFLQSEVFKTNKAANRIVLTEFGTTAVADPCRSIFQRVAAIFNPKSKYTSDNSMISVYPFGDEVYAFGEIPVIHRVNQESLETEERVDVSDFVSIVHHTSHPHVMKDGSVYNLGLSLFATGPHHVIVHFPAKTEGHGESSNMFTEAKIVAWIPANWSLYPSYMHTFGLTENYFIIVEQPLAVSIGGMVAAKVANRPMASCFRWYQHEKTKINLLSRITGSLAYTFYADAFFYLHIINQYEESDHVVLDICTYRDPAMLDCMYIDAMKNMQHNQNYAEMFRSKPVRFVLPLKPPKTHSNLVQLPNTKAEACYVKADEIFVKPETLSDLGCETPRINYEYLGKKYRYFYAISADVDAPNPGTIIKVDAVTKTRKTWCEENCYPSEPVFVPRPNSQFEDDGVVLAALVWGRDETNRVGLLILDAVTFEEVGRAEFGTPGPAPKCLHGWFLPKGNGSSVPV